MLILEDLYLGDVRPSDRSFKRNSQYAKALDEVVKAGDALTGGLKSVLRLGQRDQHRRCAAHRTGGPCALGERVGEHIQHTAKSSCVPSKMNSRCRFKI